MNAKDCWRLNLDDMLEQELQGSVGHLKGPRGEFHESAYYRALVDRDHRGFAIPSLRAGALVKVAAGLGAAALVSGGGVAVAIASTGRSDPAVWGKTVTAAVENCKDQRTADQRGIGHCVSAVAKLNGKQERAEHSEKVDSENHHSNPSAQNHANDMTAATPPVGGKDHPTGSPPGQAKSHDNGPSQTHPMGRPSGVPAGPPTSLPPGSPDTHPTGPPVSPPPHP